METPRKKTVRLITLGRSRASASAVSVTVGRPPQHSSFRNNGTKQGNERVQTSDTQQSACTRAYFLTHEEAGVSFSHVPPSQSTGLFVTAPCMRLATPCRTCVFQIDALSQDLHSTHKAALTSRGQTGISQTPMPCAPQSDCMRSVQRQHSGHPLHVHRGIASVSL